MEAIIKYLGDFNDNYNRFGKLIPKEEKLIDVKSYFECDEAREKFIVSKLLTDNKVLFRVLKEKIVEIIKDEPEKKRGRPKRGS